IPSLESRAAVLKLFDWLCQFTFPPTVQEGFLLSTPSPAFVVCGIFLVIAILTIAQSCPTLCNPIDGSPPDSSVPGVLQATILEWALDAGLQLLRCSLVAVCRSWNALASILCSTPGNIKNGRFTIYKDEYQYNEIVTYMCDPSNGPDEYSLVGESRLVCVDHDRWSSDPPECKVVKCDYPVVEHGMIVSGFRRKFYYKAQVVFKCNQGFSLHGSSTIVCNANSTWEPQIPTCAQAPVAATTKSSTTHASGPRPNTTTVSSSTGFLTGIMDQVWKIYVFFIFRNNFLKTEKSKSVFSLPYFY
ncbi:hypothetical protein FD754_020789, partial [Muntiacus muntjak]